MHVLHQPFNPRDVVAKQTFATMFLELVSLSLCSIAFCCYCMQLQAFYQLQYQQLKQTLVRVFFNHLCTIHSHCMYVCRDKLTDPEHSCCCWDSP